MAIEAEAARLTAEEAARQAAEEEAARLAEALHTQSSCPTSPRADTDNKTQEKMGSLENRVKQEFGSAK